MKKLYIIVALVVTLFTVLHVYAENTKADIANSVLRLHVVADSDTSDSQELKLKVRDAVLSEFDTISKNAKNKNDAILLAKKNIGKIRTAAREVMTQEGETSSVTVEVKKTLFPVKKYKNVILPSGYYDAVSIKIGSAKGHNWWCVMYPPLCFADCTAGELPEEELSLLKQSLSDGEYRIITEKDTNKVKICFKFLELF